MATIIELYGVPGVGKSTLANELFVAAKKAGLNVEICHEVMKEWTYNKDWRLNDQLSCLAAQYLENHKIDNILENIDILIVEAPCLNQCCWGKEIWETQFLAGNLRKKSDNIYAIHINCSEFVYNTVGRVHEIPKDLHRRIKKLVHQWFPHRRIIEGDYKTCYFHAMMLLNYIIQNKGRDDFIWDLVSRENVNTSLSMAKFILGEDGLYHLERTKEQT